MIQREESWFRVLLPSVNKKYSEQEDVFRVETLFIF